MPYKLEIVYLDPSGEVKTTDVRPNFPPQSTPDQQRFTLGRLAISVVSGKNMMENRPEQPYIFADGDSFIPVHRILAANVLETVEVAKGSLQKPAKKRSRKNAK